MLSLAQQLQDVQRQAEECLAKGDADSAVKLIEAGIESIDGAYGIGKGAPAGRNKIEMTLRREALQLWLKYFEASIQQKHLHYNPLVAAGGSNSSIDRLARATEKGIAYYRIEDKGDVINRLYLSYRSCCDLLNSWGMYESASRLHFHKMRMLTKLRVHQISQRPRVFDKLVAAINSALLGFLWLTSDFGEDPLRFIGAICVVIVGFGILYSFLGSFVEPTFAPSMDLYGRIGFGLYNSFTTVFAFGNGGAKPADLLTSLLLLFEYIFGYLFLGVFIAMLSKRLVR